MNRLEELVHVRTPVWAAQHGRGWHALLADGHYLSGFGAWTSALPGVVGAGAFVVGWRQIGFDTAVTESPVLLGLMLALGVASSQLGVALVVGFVAGNFLLAETTWILSAPPNVAIDGITDVGIVAGLVFERLPLVIHYVLISSLVLGIPIAVRGLVASMAPRIRGTQLVKLFITSVLLAVAGFVLVSFWTNAAPFVVRPLFTWGAEWERVTSPPLDAIAPTQANSAFARVAALLLLGRMALVWLASVRGDDRISRIEVEVGTRILSAGVLPRTTRRSLVVSSLVGAIAAVLFIAGLLDRLWVAVAMFLVFFVARLARTGVIPFPPARWRAAANRIPLVVRFMLVLLLMNGVAATFVGGTTSQSSFEFMMVPIAIGVLVLAFAMPAESLVAAAPGRRPSGPFGATGMMLVVLGTAGLAVVLTPGTAVADNCSSVSDCFFTAFGIELGILATFLTIGLDFIPVVGDVKGVVEGVLGRDLVTGQKLEWWERGLGLIGLSELRHLGRVARHGEHLSRLQRAGRGVRNSWDSQVDAYRRMTRADNYRNAPGNVADRWQRTTGRGPRNAPDAPFPPGRFDDHVATGHHQGNSNTKVTGGHHAPSIEGVPGGQTRRMDGPTGRPDGQGVYEGDWTMPKKDPSAAGTPKWKSGGTDAFKNGKPGSTMFPDHWSPARVRAETNSAFANATHTPLPNSGTAWEGISESGVRVAGYTDGAGNVTSAYPKRAGDLPTPPAGVAGRQASNVSEAARGGDAGHDSGRRN